MSDLDDMAPRSIFDGTWRPDPQWRGPNEPVMELEITDALYGCRSCERPYEVPVDGRPHPVAGQADFDALAVTIVDAATIRRVAYQDGRLAVDATTWLEEDGRSKREVQRVANRNPREYRMLLESRRVGDAVPGMHALAGSWQLVVADLVDHDEDTEYRIVGGVLHMQDHFGRSFEAPLDGRPAPYHGDPRYASVSVRWLDERTIEETDLRNGEPVQLLQWRVEADGETMHVRFDDLHGHVMEQNGRRLP